MEKGNSVETWQPNHGIIFGNFITTIFCPHPSPYKPHNFIFGPINQIFRWVYPTSISHFGRPPFSFHLLWQISLSDFKFMSTQADIC